MTDKELLERLRAEVAAVTPDCWSGILARVQSPAQQPEEAPVVPIPERKRRSAWRGWVAAAAVFFLVILGAGCMLRRCQAASPRSMPTPASS